MGRFSYIFTILRYAPYDYLDIITI